MGKRNGKRKASRPRPRRRKADSASEQLAVLGKLQQAVAAWLLSISGRTLRDTIDAPRLPGALYDARTLVAWWTERLKRRLGGGVSAAGERIKEARAAALERANAVAVAKLVPVEEVQRDAAAAGNALMLKLDAVGRAHGAECQRLISEAVKEFVQDLERAGQRKGGAA